MVSVRAAVAGTIIANCAFCLMTIEAAKTTKDGKGIAEDIAQVASSRKFGLMIPLLIGISTRLAALLPTTFLGTIGIFIFVALSTKAFVISVLTFALVWMDKKKHHHSKPKIMHIYHGPHTSHGHEFGSFDFESTPVRYPSYSYKKPLRKIPKIDDGSWTLTSPAVDMDSYLQQTSMTPNSYLPQTTRLPNAYFQQAMDSYLPQRHLDSYQRRRADILPSFLFPPSGVYYPRFMVANATEAPLLSNSTVGLSPQLQKFIEQSIEEDEPR